MTRIILAALVLCASAAGLPSPPGIGQNGVVNLASRIPPTLAGGAIARGALFTIYGVRLGSAGHTAVTISNLLVPIVHIDPKRIDAVMPESAPFGSDPLVVKVDGQPSKAFAVEVVASNPGIFSRNGEGWGPGRIENIDASGARSANSISNPAHPGQRVTLVTTGLGHAKELSVVVGNRVAQAGFPRQASKPGEEEITFPIPADAPRGCYVPVYLKVTPVRASNVVTMSIRSGSGSCEPGAIPPLSTQRVGVVTLFRTRIKPRKEGVADSINDAARITFNANDGQELLSPIRLLPPAGTCTAYTSSYQATTELASSISSIIGPEGRGFDAGAALTLSRGDQVRPIPGNRRMTGNYRANLGAGGSAVRRGTLPLFLEPGEFVLKGYGGRDVGPFTLTLAGPAPFEWTDRDRISIVDRARGVTLHWKDPVRDRVILIGARNIDQITTAIGMCICTARSDAGQFTILPAMLANLPATQDIPGAPYDELLIGALAAKAGLEAPGLNAGVVVSLSLTGRIVEFR